MKKLKEEVVYFMLFLLVIGIISFFIHIIFYGLFKSIV